MYKTYLIIIIVVKISVMPLFAQSNINLILNSKNYLSKEHNITHSSKSDIRFNFKNKHGNTLSNLSLIFNGNKKLTFDGSNFEYASGIATYGIGSIHRNWSFSNNTSLILSSNARPINSIYFKLKNRFNSNWMPQNAEWALEAFNGYTDKSLENSNSNLLGLRVTFTPTSRLSFEALQSVQWGGEGFSNSYSNLLSKVFMDSNSGTNANINKMAGVGISYKLSNTFLPIRIYSQIVGEDEAGSLPYCLLHLAGLEWQSQIGYSKTLLGFEFVDTRTSESAHGYCGSNTAYNNNTYKYTNSGVTMGAPIDTEGKSIELFGKSQISKKLSMKYSIKYISINESNWSNHRLSSTHKTGYVDSINLSWLRNNMDIIGGIYHQGITLDNANIKKGSGAKFQISFKF